MKSDEINDELGNVIKSAVIQRQIDTVRLTVAKAMSDNQDDVDWLISDDLHKLVFYHTEKTLPDEIEGRIGDVLKECFDKLINILDEYRNGER